MIYTSSFLRVSGTRDGHPICRKWVRVTWTRPEVSDGHEQEVEVGVIKLLLLLLSIPSYLLSPWHRCTYCLL